ncbi:MAG: hypothetical protein ACLFPD_07435 [Desulfosudaceae bacterium]
MNDVMRSNYGYGVASIPMPLPALSGRGLDRRFWLQHPTFYGLLGALVIIWLIRSCVMPVTRPSRTVLWLHRVPEPVDIEPPRIAPRARVAEKKTPAPAPEPPKLVSRQQPPPKRVVLNAPRQLPAAEKPVLPNLKANRPAIDRNLLTRPENVTVAPAAAPDALTSRQQETDRRLLRQPDNAPVVAPAPAPTRAAAAADRQTSRPAAARPDDHDFTPLPRSTDLEKPDRAARAQPPRQESAMLASGSPTAGPAPAPPVHRPAAAAGSGVPAADDNAVVRPGSSYSPALSAASQPRRFAGSRDDAAAGVTIAGIVEGESSRVLNLKRLILNKAREMRPGAYCCRIRDVECRLEVAPDRTVAISFSRDPIAFEIVSRLERRLPEGVQPCEE